MPLNLNSDNTYLTMQGRRLLFTSASVDVGTYGQIGKSHIVTTATQLQRAGIDLPALTNGSPRGIDIQLTVNNQTLFGGLYLHAYYRLERDEVEIWSRDYSGILFDTKRSLADLNYQNVHVSDLVDQICRKFNLRSFIRIHNDPLVGTVTDQSAVMNTYPQPLWSLLVFLARYTGAQIRMTVNGVLHFEDPDPNPTGRLYGWMFPPAADFLGPAATRPLPIMRLELIHQPQRNKNFTVFVVSHHQQSTVTTTQHVTVLGDDIPISRQRTIKAGFYSGSAGQQVRQITGARALGLPVFEFRKDGLRPQDVQDYAQSLAREIAMKLLITTAVVGGNGDLQPGDRFVMQEGQDGALLGFNNIPQYITGVSQHLEVPQDDEIATEGWLTTIKALNLPPAQGETSPEELQNMLGG